MGITSGQCGAIENGITGVIVDNKTNHDPTYVDYLGYEISRIPVNRDAFSIKIGATGVGAASGYEKYLYQFDGGVGLKFSVGGSQMTLLDAQGGLIVSTGILGLSQSENYVVTTEIANGQIRFGVANYKAPDVPLVQSPWGVAPASVMGTRLFVGSKAKTNGVAAPMELAQWGTSDSETMR